jgi:hypothetical protein
VNVYLVPTGQGVETLAITGATGDYAKTTAIEKNGATDPPGEFTLRSRRWRKPRHYARIGF